MHVLYVVGRYPTLSQTFVDLEIRTIVKLGHKVDVLSCVPGEKALSREEGPPLQPLHPLTPPSTIAFWRPSGPDVPVDRSLRTRIFADSVAAWFIGRHAQQRYDLI